MAEDRRVEETSDLLEFTYAWPSEASAIPTLAARLETELGARRREALETARSDRQARGSDAPFFGHFFKKEWMVAGDTPRLLSIEAEISFYTGGAHPNTLFDAILWDRQEDRALGPVDWFTVPQNAFAALDRLYCPALDRQRLEKRDGATMPPGTWETACPPLDKQVIVPADRDGNGRFERLTVMLPPYEAGPYAEGRYVVEVPLDSVVIAQIRPELQPSFEPQLQ